MDNLHETSLLVGCWPARVGDDGGVWFLVECDKVDSTELLLFKMGWSDGNFDLSSWGNANQGTEWELSNNVALESSLVFLVQEWNLEAQFLMCFPGIDWVEFSLDLHVFEVIFGDKFHESSDGNMDGHTEVVGGWESKDGWDFHEVLTEMEGLLEVDWVSGAEFGESLELELLDQFLQHVFVEREHAFHLILDLHVESSFNDIILLALLDSQDFTDLSNIFMSFTISGSWLVDLFHQIVDEFLCCVSVEGEFHWNFFEGTISVLEPVLVVNVVWED